MSCSYVNVVYGDIPLYPLPTGQCAKIGDASVMAECNGNSGTIKMYSDTANCTGNHVSADTGGGTATFHNCPNPSCDYFLSCMLDGETVSATALNACIAAADDSVMYTRCSGETGSQSVESTWYIGTTECSGTPAFSKASGLLGWDDSCNVCSRLDNGNNNEATKSTTSEPQTSKAPSSSTSDAFDVKPKGLVVFGLIAAVTVVVSITHLI